MVQLSHLYMTTGKTRALPRQTFVGKVMSLLSNMLTAAAKLQAELLKVPWTARRSNQSIRRKISPEYSLEELMLKLKL